MNRIILVGRLTRDPDLRSTQSGTSVCNFGIAVDRRVRKDAGTPQQTADFINVVAWGRQAEVISQYLGKGRQIALEGRLQSRTYQDQKTGDRRTAYEVHLDSFDFIGGKRDGGTEPQQAAQAPRQARPQGKPKRQQTMMDDSRLDDFDEEFTLMADDDDVPF